VKEPDLKKLAIAVSALCLLEALTYFLMGWAGSRLFLAAGATAAQAFEIARDEISTGLLILLGGFLHWIAPRLRIPLAVAGVFGGFYGAYFLVKSSNLLTNWNILNGDIISAGNWSEAILMVLAVACAAELAILAKGTT
jgi:hypothetical protein